MDGLLALREAIVHRAPITEQGDLLVVNEGNEDAVNIARNAKTPFKNSGGGHYTVDALWMQYHYKELRHGDFWKEYDKRGVSKAGAVIVSDKEHVLSYLEGRYDGADHIDREFVPTAPAVTRASGSGPAASATGAVGTGRTGGESGDAVANDASAAQAAALAAMRVERPLRTRVTIMDAPGYKNFSELVFDYFKRAEPASAAGGAGGPKPSSSKRGRDKDAAAAAPAGPAGGESKKSRFVGNPIIIVPNAPTSMITLHNAKQLLEQGSYVPPATAKAGITGLLSTVTITHERGTGSSSTAAAVSSLPTQFDVIDNVSKLQASDWPRVVAVFVLGAEWQFKGWTLGKPPGSVVRPVDVFAFALSFHVQQDDAAPTPNIAKWPVTRLPINKSKRHLDVVAVNKFWSMLDAYMLSKRQYLLKDAPEATAE